MEGKLRRSLIKEFFIIAQEINCVERINEYENFCFWVIYVYYWGIRISYSLWCSHVKYLYKWLIVFCGYLAFVWFN